MNSLVVQIAGIKLLISYNYIETRFSFAEFEITGDYQYEVAISRQRFQEEKILLEQRFPLQKFKNHEIERNALYRDIPQVLAKEGVIIMHGVLVGMDGIGYLFSAPSGTGKSTHAKLWTDVFPNKAFVINGDKPLLKITDCGVIAYGSPWKGKEKIGTNECINLRNICHIKRGDSCSIKRLEWNTETLMWLLNQSHIAGVDSQILERIKWFKTASRYISLFELQCTISPESVKIAYNGMNMS